jgi:hypothetical protein
VDTPLQDAFVIVDENREIRPQAGVIRNGRKGRKHARRQKCLQHAQPEDEQIFEHGPLLYLNSCTPRDLDSSDKKQHERDVPVALGMVNSFPK